MTYTIYSADITCADGSIKRAACAHERADLSADEFKELLQPFVQHERLEPVSVRLFRVISREDLLLLYEGKP